jgi:hypothetical protein
MTTPTVTELIRNGNAVESRTAPARPGPRLARPPAPAPARAPAPAPAPAISVLGGEDRRAGSQRRDVSPPAERTPVLQLAA